MYQIYFPYNYFTITGGGGGENIVCYIEDFAIKRFVKLRFHCTLFVDFVFSAGGGMLMDPFRTGGQGFGPPPHPGQLPRFVICL